MPEYEYRDKIEKEVPGEVEITLTSVISGMSDISIFGEDDGADTEMSITEEENCTYTMTGSGTLTKEDGRVYLRYSEAPDDEGNIAKTEISFLESEPDCVCIARSGEASASFVIKKGVRQTSAYNTPFGTLEMCTLAKKVQNDISAESGGTLKLDYAVELRGLTAQRTKMILRAERRSEK